MRRLRIDFAYLALLAGSFLMALVLSWNAEQLDNSAYDWMFRRYDPPGWQTESALLAGG